MDQNKIRTYIWYAIGEVFLVVIGILIALQVNNWNEEQKEAHVKDQYLQQLKLEASQNIENFNNTARYYLDRSSMIKKTVEAIEKGERLPENINSFQKWGLDPTFIQTWNTQTSVYDEIISTGSLRLIQDDTLKTLLGIAYKQAQFGYQQLEYWRQVSVEDTRIFDRYKTQSYSPSEPNTNPKIYLDIESLKEDSFPVNRMGFWGAAHMLFYQGLISQSNYFKAVKNRIDHIQNSN